MTSFECNERLFTRWLRVPGSACHILNWIKLELVKILIRGAHRWRPHVTNLSCAQILNVLRPIPVLYKGILHF